MVDRLNKPDKGTTDWHVPLNENFEDVEEASYVERTVEDWESGTLDTDVYTANTGKATVQNSVSKTGYALKLDSDGSPSNFVVGSTSGLETYPQAGDSFTYYTQLSDTDDLSKFYFAVPRPFSSGVPDEYYESRVRADIDSFVLRDDDSSTVDSVDAPISSNLNEILQVDVDWGLNGVISATLYDAGGNELGSVEITNAEYNSGGLAYALFNRNSSSSVYFDDLTIHRRETQARTNTQQGTTQLGNEVVPSGGINTGPQEVPPDHPSYPFVNAPVTDGLSQGETVGYHMAINEEKALTVEAEADGNGGIQNEQLRPHFPFDRVISERTQAAIGQYNATPQNILLGFSGAGGLGTSTDDEFDYGAVFRIPQTTQIFFKIDVFLSGIGVAQEYYSDLTYVQHEVDSPQISDGSTVDLSGDTNVRLVGVEGGDFMDLEVADVENNDRCWVDFTVNTSTDVEIFPLK